MVQGYLTRKNQLLIVGTGLNMEWLGDSITDCTASPVLETKSATKFALRREKW
jgi:hypothetical protein